MPDESGCRLWTGAINGKRGYGILTVAGKPKTAHRAIYEATHGPIAAGMVVMHSCDVPRCVEITHLTVGTLSDNARDMARKGRGKNHLGPYGKR